MCGFDTGEFLVEALKAKYKPKCKAILIHAEAMEESGVGASDMDGVLENVVGVIVYSSHRWCRLSIRRRPNRG